MPTYSESDKRLWYVVGAIAIIMVTVIVLLTAKALSNKNNASTTGNAAVSTTLMSELSGVSADTFTTVAQGSVQSLPVAATAPALTNDGKPEVFYLGAEYCPYCAAERWAMVVALSRFGTFSGLTLTTSSATDIYPSTPTLSFHGSTYTSDFLSFVAVEMQTNKPNGSGGYTALDTLTDAQKTLVNTYDAAPYLPSASAGAIPFIDFGGKFLSAGASFSPQVLANKTHEEIGAALSSATDPITQGVIGAANVMTAAFCTLTGDQPSNVCTTGVIPQLKQALAAK